MQAASTEKRTSQWVSTFILSVGIGMAIILFGAAISRMGLLNGLMGAETAVPEGTIFLSAKAMRFGQTEMHIKAGQDVNLILDNEDMVGHSFDVDDLNLHVMMDANGRSTISFTPTEPGTYDIYCGVPGHLEAGMVSMLIVEP